MGAPHPAWPQQSARLRRRYPDLAGEIPEDVFFDPFFSTTFLQVRPKEGGFRPLVLNSQQCVLASYYKRARALNKWLVHVKPRKVGSSTLFAAILTWDVMFRPGYHAAVAGFTSDPQGDAAEVSKIVMNYYAQFTKDYPGVAPRRNTIARSYLDLPEPHSSTVMLYGASDADPGRGGTKQYLHGTEISSWKTQKAQEAWAALLGSMPDDGFVVAESTPKYPGDPLHQVWQDANRRYGDNGMPYESKWIGAFLAWHMLEDYALDPPEDWEPSGMVRTYQDRHADVDLRHLYWMHRVGLAKAANSLEVFGVEFPYSPDECWESRGNGLFDVNVLAELFKELNPSGAWSDKLYDEEKWYGKLRPKTHYLITIDPASDLAAVDLFGVEMFDCLSREQMYERHTPHKAEAIVEWLFGALTEGGRTGGVVDRILAIGSTVKILVESNTIGETIIKLIRQADGGKFLVWAPRDGKKQVGFYSHKALQVLAVTAAQHMVADRSLVIRSPRLVRHMQTWPGLDAKRKKMRDPAGGHFDLLTCLYMTAWYLEYRTDDFLKQELRVAADETPSEGVVLGGPPLMSYLRNGLLPAGARRGRYGVHG